MNGPWGILCFGPDRTPPRWLRPIDQYGVDVAVVFRSHADAEAALLREREKFGVLDAEVHQFAWEKEGS